MTDSPPVRVIAFADAAAALGIARSSLAMLKVLTKPVMQYFQDPAAKRRNRRLYLVDEFVAWVEYHMPVREDQIANLQAAARDFIPGHNTHIRKA